MNAIVYKSGGSEGLNFKTVIDFDLTGYTAGTDVTKSQYETSYILIQLKNAIVNFVLFPCVQLPESDNPIKISVFDTNRAYYDFLKIYGFTSDGRSYVSMDSGNRVYIMNTYIEKFALVTL